MITLDTNALTRVLTCPAPVPGETGRGAIIDRNSAGGGINNRGQMQYALVSYLSMRTISGGPRNAFIHPK